MESDWEHVILLSADALRADHLSCYGYDRDTSPNIDAIAAESVRFENAHSVSSHTREAIPALLTGRYPDEAVDGNYHLGVDSIAQTLSEHGFNTGGFHSNPFVSRAYGYGRGFDVFDDDLHLGQHKLLTLAQRALDKLRGRHYARANEINERALSWVDSTDADTSFFLWNHYMDVHGPYEPPSPYNELYTDRGVGRDVQSLYQRAIRNPGSISETERELLVDLYDAEIRYVDDRIGDFVDGLRERGLLKDALVIFTADHGDAFGEHGYYEHPRYLDAELTHVPLLVRPPNARERAVSTPTSTLDVVATVLDGIEFESGEDLAGRPLLELADFERTVFTQARGENEDRIYRRYAARTRDDACFCERNMNTDSVEFGDCPDRSLRARLEEHVESRIRHERDDDGDHDREVNDGVKRRLNALGYRE